MSKMSEKAQEEMQKLKDEEEKGKISITADINHKVGNHGDISIFNVPEKEFRTIKRIYPTHHLTSDGREWVRVDKIVFFKGDSK